MRIIKFAKKIKVKARTFYDKFSKTKWVRTLLILCAALVLIFLAKTLLFAAFVNGRPISRISLIKELEKQGGQEVLDNLIEKNLVFQEAGRQGVKIEQATLDFELSRIEELLKEQGTTLEEALSIRGETKADLVEQIKLQKIVETILSPKINISEEDVKTYYEENKDLFGAEANFEENKDSIKEQLFQQKLGKEYATWIEELKSKAKILYFLKF